MVVLRGGAVSYERGTPAAMLLNTSDRIEIGMLRKVLISHKVLIKSFWTSQFPHKSVNLSFIITNIKNKLTFFCGIDFSKTTL